jgi:hypothetical protein
MRLIVVLCGTVTWRSCLSPAEQNACLAPLTMPWASTFSCLMLCGCSLLQALQQCASQLNAATSSIAALSARCKQHQAKEAALAQQVHCFITLHYITYINLQPEAASESD